MFRLNCSVGAGKKIFFGTIFGCEEAGWCLCIMNDDRWKGGIAIHDSARDENDGRTTIHSPSLSRDPNFWRHSISQNLSRKSQSQGDRAPERNASFTCTRSTTDRRSYLLTTTTSDHDDDCQQRLSTFSHSNTPMLSSSF